MYKLLNRAEDILVFLAFGSTFLMACLTTMDAGGRYLLKSPIQGSYEIVERYLMVYSVFFALCYTYREGGNIRVDFVVTRLPKKLKDGISYFVQIFSLLICVALLVSSTIFALHRISDNQITELFSIPLAPAYMAVPVGLFFVSLRMFLDLWQIKKGKSGLFKEGATGDDVI